MIYIPPDEVNRLKTPECLLAFCRSLNLGEPKHIGHEYHFPRCPFADHEKQHFDATDKNGIGQWTCRACGKSGDIFKLAAEITGKNPKHDFVSLCLYIAECLGLTLRVDHSHSLPHIPHQLPTCYQKANSTASSTLQWMDDKIMPYVENAIHRAQAQPDTLQKWATILSLPIQALKDHTNIAECWEMGMIGIDSKGHLLYIYTYQHPITGERRVLAVKKRHTPEEISANFPRFTFLSGSHPSAFWGASSIYSDIIFITEGESDCIALRHALYLFLEYWRTTDPDNYPSRENMPTVLAKPSSHTIKPAWAYPLRGKTVVICADADAAGKQGADTTAGIIRQAGAAIVSLWFPPEHCKDVREVYNYHMTQDRDPSALIDSILSVVRKSQ